MNRVRSRLFTILFCWLCHPLFLLTAQGPPPEFVDRVDFFKSIGQLLSAVKPWITDKSAVKSMISDHQSSLREALKWKGVDGVLFEVQVEEEVNTGVSRILGDPIKHGEGNSPLDVLALSVSRDSMGKSPSQGFRFSKEKSFFVWYTWDGKKARNGLIRPIASVAMRSEANAKASDAELISSLKAKQREEIRDHIVKVMMQEARAAEDKAIIEEAQKRIKATQAEMTRIQETLKQDLSDAANAGRLHGDIMRLKGILDVATMVFQVNQALADQTVPDQAKNDPQKLAEYVEQYTVKKNGLIVELRKSLTISIEDMKARDEELSGIMLNNKVPKEIIHENRRP